MTNTALKEQIDQDITGKTEPKSLSQGDIGNNLKSVVDYVDQEVDVVLEHIGTELAKFNPSVLSFNASIPYTRKKAYMSTTLTGNISLTPNTTGAIDDAEVVVKFLAGNYTVNLDAYSNMGPKVVDMSLGVNIVRTWLENGTYYCLVTRPFTAGQDVTPPYPVSAQVANSTPNRIDITMNEQLDGTSVPPNSAFTVPGKTILSVAIVGNSVRVTVGSNFVSGDVISISMSNAGTPKLKDLANNNAADFSSFAVTNNVGVADTTPPAVVSMTATSPTNIRVVMTEPEPSPEVAGWSFNNGGAIIPSAVALVSGQDRTYDFTVAGLAAGQTITGSYNSATGAWLDAAGNELVTFSNAAVTNSVPAPTLADIIFDGLYNVVNSGSKNWTHQAGGASNLTTPKLKANTLGYFQQKYLTSANDLMIMALDPDNIGETYANMKFGVYWGSSFGIRLVVNGALVNTINGTNRYPQANDLLRLRRIDVSGVGTIVAEWSSNGGTSWTVAHTFAETTYVDLYAKGTATSNGTVMSEPMQYNFAA